MEKRREVSATTAAAPVAVAPIESRILIVKGKEEKKRNKDAVVWKNGNGNMYGKNGKNY